MRANSILLALVTLALAPAVHAETKPQISLTSRAAEITVTVEPSLRKHPGLYENCLAEGGTWAERNRAEAAKELLRKSGVLQTRGAAGRTSGATTSAPSSAATSACCATTAPTRAARIRIPAPTPSCGTATRGGRMNVRPFFRDTRRQWRTDPERAGATCPPRRRRREAQARQRQRRGPEGQAHAGARTRRARFDDRQRHPAVAAQARPDPARPLDRARQKLPASAFHYSPYAVGSYAEGQYIVFVPWTDFKAHLSPQGAALFGGSSSRKRRRFL